MFEIRKSDESANKNNVLSGRHYFLAKNSVEIEGVDVYEWNSGTFEITTNLRESSQELSKYKLKDFQKIASSISLNGITTLDNLDVNVEIILEKKKDYDFHFFLSEKNKNIDFNKYNIKLYIVAKLSYWKSKYSFADYRRIYYSKIENYFHSFDYYLDSEIDIDDEGNNFLILSYINHNFSAQNIIENIKPYLIALDNCHEETIKFLENEVIEEGLSELFNFPEELKIPCEQYLIYFATFLKDLGINATSNLKEEAGKVLFSVTPTDDVEVLDKIREALAVYLNLPSSPIEYNESFAGMRLQQQVENLQHSQRMAVREIRASENELRLAQAVIEQQNKIILQKDSIVDQKDKIIEKLSRKSIMTDSLENKEKLCEGLEFVPSEALKKYLGVIFQPVSFFKQLGTHLLGKEEETISILNSGEIDKGK